MSTTVILLILTALCWGSAPILEKIGLAKISPLNAIAIRSFTITAVLATFMLLTGRIKALIAVDTKSLFLFAFSGVLAGLLGMWAYLGALRLQPTSKIVPIAAAYPLVTALLSVLILKEGITLPRLGGTILIIIGIWLVKGAP